MPTPLENCYKLQALLGLCPPDRLNLATFARTTKCGTIYCIAGLAAAHPYFQAQGLSLANVDQHGAHLKFNGKTIWQDGAEMEDLFGKDARYVFNPWDGGYEAVRGSFPDFPVEVDGVVDDIYIFKYLGKRLDDYTLATLRLAYHVRQLEKQNAHTT